MSLVTFLVNKEKARQLASYKLGKSRFKIVIVSDYFRFRFIVSLLLAFIILPILSKQNSPIHNIILHNKFLSTKKYGDILCQT